MSMLQVWFKHDLRLDDHPGLQEAVTGGTSLVPVYCFDPSQLGHLLRASHGLEGDHACCNMFGRCTIVSETRKSCHSPCMPWQAKVYMHNTPVSSVLGHALHVAVTPAVCCAVTGLLGAVKALKQGLQQLGSDLVILWGPTEQQLPLLIDQIQASSLILEEEIEYR